MKESHIRYMQDLCGSIALDGNKPFVGDHFLEVSPSLDTYQMKAPLVVCRHENVTSKRVGRRIQRLPRKGAKLRFVKQLYYQVHTYRLEFWLTNPAHDILSNKELPGIVDQALDYTYNKWVITDETGAPIRIEPGISSVVKDPDKDTKLYYVFLELSFFDGLHQVEEAKTLSGSQIEITNKGDI